MLPRISRLIAAALLVLCVGSGPAWALQDAPSEHPPAKPAELSQAGQSELAHAANTAAEENQGAEAELRQAPAVKALARLLHVSVDQAYWIAVVLNFAIVIGVLWVILKRVLPGTFRQREESIRKRMEDARKASEEARLRRAEVEGRLSRLDSEIQTLRSQAEEAAAAEEGRMKESTEQERLRIVQSAEQEIAAAINAARRELKAYTASLAVDLAEKKIKISEATDEMLVRSFVDQLGKDGH